MEEVVILGAKRTPMGAFQGELAGASATALGSAAIKASIDVASIKPDAVEEVIMGSVLMAGLGQAPARQASIGAGLSKHVPCTTINKVCGSGMKAVMQISDMIRLGDIRVGIAGGMESMTNAPYFLSKARSGFRMGHGAVIDHMFYDGLENAYDHKLMGHFADETAKKYNFTREAQDAFAENSGKKALEAQESGAFKAEIAAIKLNFGKTELEVHDDEPPSKVRFDKISSLKPAFSVDGTVTAANASSIADGAAALVLSSRSFADHNNLKPRAIIRGYTSNAHEPEWFTTAPCGAIKKLTDQLGWDINEVDLFEINEAFAVVAMAAMHDLKIPEDKVNIHGGACALGHPLGASGARIIVTLLHALESRNLKRGIASLCIGGGEATALAIEICED